MDSSFRSADRSIKKDVELSFSEKGVPVSFDQPRVDEEEKDEPLLPEKAAARRAVRPLCDRLCIGMGVCFAFSAIIAVAVPLGIRAILNPILDNEALTLSEQFINWNYQADNRLVCYFLNVTNPHAVLEGAKPLMEEIGPFVYDYSRIRSDLDWNDEMDSVSFKQHRYYVFNKNLTRERSGGVYDDDQALKITTVRLFFYGIKALTPLLLNVLFNKDSVSDFDRLFTQRSPRELIAGYADETNVFLVPGLISNFTKEEDPDFVTPSEISTGKKNIENVGSYLKWRGGADLNHSYMQRKSVNTEPGCLCPWRSATCPGWPCCADEVIAPWQDVLPPGDEYEGFPRPNDVYGNGGEQFHPHVRKDERLWLWVDLLFRSVPFEQTEETEWVHGLETYRYQIPNNMMGNATDYPPNWSFYMYGPHGLQNLSVVQGGVPIFASKPHFLGCGAAAIDGVDGLKPDPKLHEAYFNVEPMSGKSVRGHKRLMVSMHVETLNLDSPNVTWFGGLRGPTYIPVGWFDMESEANDQGMAALGQLRMINWISTGALYGGVGLGLLIVIIVAIRLAIRWTNKEYSEAEKPFM